MSFAAASLPDTTMLDQPLSAIDLELWKSIDRERCRQDDQIEFIASENIVSRGVRQVHGSALTNKYAEGYPGKRYCGGCEHVDVAERLGEPARGLAFRLPLVLGREL